MSEQMKNKRDLSDTMDVNVELARKAVGSLFFNEDDGDPEDVPQEDAAQQRERWSEIKRHRAEKHKVEDDKPVFANTSPLPTPKPAVKVNPNIPAVSRVPIRSERQPIAEEDDMSKKALFHEDDDTQNSYAGDEISNDEGEFADFRQRLELARKAVDSLFLSEDTSGPGAEKRLTEKHSPQEYKHSKHKNEIHEDKKTTDDGEAITGRASPKAPSPVQTPKPGVRVNKSTSSASHASPRPERRSATDENHTPKDVKPHKDRTLQSRYVFVGEDNESDETPKSVKPAKTRTQSRYVFIDEDGDVEGLSKNMGSPKDHTARNHHAITEKGDNDDQSADIYQKYRDIDKKVASKAYRPKPKPVPADGTGIHAASGLPSFMRGIIAAFTVMLLLMMVFLIHRAAVLSDRLEEANLQLLSIPALEHELNSVRIDLEGAREALAAAEAENTRLTNLASSDTLTNDLSGENESYEGSADYPANENADVPAAAEPSPQPGATRTHIVVRGDSLTRIANQFYGSSSPAYIQRIMEANNITNPDSIVIGDQLIIP